jgi:hypothetical protein
LSLRKVLGFFLMPLILLTTILSLDPILLVLLF